MAILNSLIVNGNSRILNTLYAKDMTISNSFTMGGRLVLSKASDVTLTSASDPALVIGPLTGTHLEFDQNEIMAKTNNSTGVGTLNLNIEGGQVSIGKSSLTYVNTDGKLCTTNFKSTGTIESATINNSGKITSYDGNFTNVLRATTWDLQSIQATKGGALYIAPTYVQGSTFVNVVTTSTTMVIQDTGISSKSFSGIDWNAGARVKISGTIGGVTTGTVEGILAANMNNTANKLELKSLSGGNWSSVAANTYTAGTSGCHDLTVMLYNTGTYPVGILLNCYGTNNKATIDIYGGTSATPHVAIGLLNGRFSQLDGVDVSGWGIYTDNGYFTGTIHAGSGRIGGFEIASSAIKTAGVAVTSNADNSVSLSSADFTRTINSTSRSGLRFAIGDKFGVTGDGVIYASSATISGSITATSGTIGGCSITNGVLQVASANITALDAAKITSGTIAADRIGANSITADKLTVDAMTVGSKNLLVGTTTAKSQAVNVPSSYVVMDCYYTPKSMEIINLGAKKDDLLQITFDWSVSSATTYGNFRIECYGTTSSSTNAYIGRIGDAPIVTTSASNLSGTVHASVKLTDALLKTKNIRIRVDNSVLTLTISNMVLWYGSGGFQMDSDSIHTANVAISSNADNSIGLSSVDFTRTVAGASRSGLRFAIGDKFGVTGDGVIYASSAVISGTLTAGANSKIGPWTVTTTSIYKTNSAWGDATSGATYFGNDGISITDRFKVSNTGVITLQSASISNYAGFSGVTARHVFTLDESNGLKMTLSTSESNIPSSVTSSHMYLSEEVFDMISTHNYGITIDENGTDIHGPSNGTTVVGAPYTTIMRFDSTGAHIYNHTDVMGNLSPFNTNTYSLGTSSLYWNAAYIKTLYISSSISSTGNINPSKTNTYSLGTSSLYWNTAYIKTLTVSSGATINSSRITTASEIYSYSEDSYAFPAAKNCTTATNTNFGSITLPAGVYIVEYEISFASNSSGRREAWLSESSTGSNMNRYARTNCPAVNGATTFVHDTFISAYTTSKTFYLVGYQNSGSTLSCTAGIRAIRLINGTDYGGA